MTSKRGSGISEAPPPLLVEHPAHLTRDPLTHFERYEWMATWRTETYWNLKGCDFFFIVLCIELDILNIFTGSCICGFFSSFFYWPQLPYGHPFFVVISQSIFWMKNPISLTREVQWIKFSKHEPPFNLAPHMILMYNTNQIYSPTGKIKMCA